MNAMKNYLIHMNSSQTKLALRPAWGYYSLFSALALSSYAPVFQALPDPEAMSVLGRGLETDVGQTVYVQGRTALYCSGLWAILHRVLEVDEPDPFTAMFLVWAFFFTSSFTPFC